MTAKPGAPLIAMLRSGRAAFNEQFALAKRRYPELDAESFQAFLVSAIDPWVTATAAVRPDSVAQVVMAGYELALELVGQRLAGTLARHDLIEQGLHRILPAAARIAPDAPLVLAASISNALHQLAQTPGTRPGHWISEMERLLPLCTSVESLLTAGKLCAWRSGLAHYRKSALAAGDKLPEALALSAVGADSGARWTEVRARLDADPWFVPGTAGAEDGGARVAASFGAFRGFGGVFTEPPEVLVASDWLLVQSAGEVWLLTADACGATLHTASPTEIGLASRQRALPAGVRVAEGTLTCRGQTLPLPTRGAITSVAWNENTLAITSSLTHSIVLVALGS
jgi:hypothetical protein